MIDYIKGTLRLFRLHSVLLLLLGFVIQSGSAVKGRACTISGVVSEYCTTYEVMSVVGPRILLLAIITWSLG